MLGPPASGKGTLAEMIQRKHGIPVLSPGSVFRAEKQKGTLLGETANRLTRSGQLLPDEAVMQVVRGWVHERGSEFVFDGFPRTLGQAISVETFLKERSLSLDVVILLEADVDTLQRRVEQRLICDQCGRIVSALLQRQSNGQKCSACEGTLVRRDDDTLETLSRRLREYREKTEPLIEFYRERDLLQTIDSMRLPEDVFRSVEVILQ